MKRVILLLPFFLGLKGQSQYDTSHIRKVYDYLHTDEFKSLLKESSDRRTEENIRNYKAIRKRADKYREEQYDRVRFWTSPGKCFIPSRFYNVPDTSTRYSFKNKIDTLMFWKYNELDLGLAYSYSPPNKQNCTDEIKTRVKFLAPDVLEVFYYEGDPQLRFGVGGYTEILRFKVNSNGIVQFLLQGQIFYE